MGYIKHDAIVVTSWDEENFGRVHEKAKELLGAVPEDGWEFNYVSEIVDSQINGYKSFFIAPDGSKEGWKTSDVAESLRDEFVRWIENEAKCYCEALVASFGGDDDDITVKVVHGTR